MYSLQYPFEEVNLHEIVPGASGEIASHERVVPRGLAVFYSPDKHWRYVLDLGLLPVTSYNRILALCEALPGLGREASIGVGLGGRDSPPADYHSYTLRDLADETGLSKSTLHERKSESFNDRPVCITSNGRFLWYVPWVESLRNRDRAFRKTLRKPE